MNMKENSTYYYDKVANAIQYLDDHFKEQPSLEEIATHMNLSPYHFQRIFTEWVGVSPKKYIQFLSVNYAKNILEQSGKSLFDTALDTGLSGTGRLHDLFVNIEGMTPGEYKNGGEKLTIHYSFAETPFGDILVAATQKGVCFMSFIMSQEEGKNVLKKEFPNAIFVQKADKMQQDALFIFQNDWSKLNEIKLHLKGSDFQLKVWEALLSIPQGKLTTYGVIAKKIHQPNASRAVGTAIGNNPVAFLIPCHRVIQSSGKFGGYRWNPIRKKAIIGWEAAQLNHDFS
ncbi:methylated-DNA--[protein]-cysteine S-methyltransferase [bacterium SCSIO 12643]|nr:methylated-DNA--[protein]-cysteine S-methyltransferase [bacterium SCSIO 12643]